MNKRNDNFERKVSINSLSVEEVKEVYTTEDHTSLPEHIF